MPSANDITRLLLLELPRRYPCRCWRRNSFAAKIGNRFIRSSQLPGEADITGILNINGVGIRLEVEVKCGRDSLRPAQIVFGRMIESCGGIYIVARDVESALNEIEIRRRSLAARIRTTDS